MESPRHLPVEGEVERENKRDSRVGRHWPVLAALKMEEGPPAAGKGKERPSPCSLQKLRIISVPVLIAMLAAGKPT